MSIQNQIERITRDRDTIRSKLSEFGLFEQGNTKNLDECATAIDEIPVQAKLEASLKEGESFTIPQGYHKGDGVIKGIAGGGNYKLQAKTGIIPKKSVQSITSDDGFYGLSSVSIEPIPVTFQDVTSVTATASDVLATKIIVDSKGKVITGSMPNNGSVKGKVSIVAPSFTIERGYHDGTGTVGITTERKSVIPTKLSQTITPTSGSVLSEVTVSPIPENFIDTTAADALEDEILVNKTAYVNGVKIVGSMPNNGDVSGVINGMSLTQSFSIPAGYTSGGTVTLSQDIENALAEI